MTRVRVAVTGTDTGVGKTVTACALVAALRASGLTVAAMKPVETGIPDDDATSDPATTDPATTDAARLRRAAGGADPIDLVRPLRYDEPLAPWIAAERAGRPVEIARLDAAFERLTRGRDAIVVEGAGGLLVPFAEDLTLADLATRWRLDVVIVAANRLGAINHTLLTLREAERRGLAVRAIALVAPESSGIAEGTNVDAIARLAAPVPVVAMPRLSDVDDLAALAGAGAPLATTLLEGR